MRDATRLGKPTADLLIEVRRRREEAAEARLSAAVAARRIEEAEQARLAAHVAAARSRLDEGRRAAFGAAPVRAADVLARDRYLGRLGDEAADAEAAAARHRAEPLARAAAAEQSARRAHVEARRGREAAERHQARAAAAARRVAERRGEDAVDDLVRARTAAAKLRTGG